MPTGHPTTTEWEDSPQLHNADRYVNETAVQEYINMDDGEMAMDPAQGDSDVFGHGGALDQEVHGDGSSADIPGLSKARVLAATVSSAGVVISSDHGDRIEGARCTVIRGLRTGEPIRDRAWIWADPDSAVVRIRKEDDSEEELYDMRNTLVGVRSGKYSVGMDNDDIRIVFTNQDAVRHFLETWGEASVPCNICEGTMRTCLARPRDNCEHPICPGCHAEAALSQGVGSTRCIACAPGKLPSARRPNASASMRGTHSRDRAHDRSVNRETVEEDWADRGRRARARLEDLRRRVAARGVDVATGDRRDQTEDGPVVVQPAPATPRVEPAPGEGEADREREVDMGCGCKGRLHEECARRVRRRVIDTSAAHTGDELGSVVAGDDGEALPVEHPPSDRPSTTPSGRLRAACASTSHQLYHHHRRECAGERFERERYGKRTFCDTYSRSSTHSCYVQSEEGSDHRHRHHRERREQSADLEQGDGGQGARHSSVDEDETRKEIRGRAEETEGILGGAGVGGGWEEENGNGTIDRTNYYPYHHHHHPPSMPELRGVRQHASLRADPPDAHLWGSDSRCRGYPSKARPPPTADVWEGEVAVQAGQGPNGPCPTIDLAITQVSFQALAHHAAERVETHQSCVDPICARRGAEPSHGQARDGPEQPFGDQREAHPAQRDDGAATARGPSQAKPPTGGGGLELRGQRGRDLQPGAGAFRDQRDVFGRGQGAVGRVGEHQHLHNDLHADPHTGPHPRHAIHQVDRIASHQMNHGDDDETAADGGEYAQKGNQHHFSTTAPTSRAQLLERLRAQHERHREPHHHQSRPHRAAAAHHNRPMLRHRVDEGCSEQGQIRGNVVTEAAGRAEALPRQPSSRKELLLHLRDRSEAQRVRQQPLESLRDEGVRRQQSSHRGHQGRAQGHRQLDQMEDDHLRMQAHGIAARTTSCGARQTRTFKIGRNDIAPPGDEEGGGDRAEGQVEDTRGPSMKRELSGPPPHRKRRRTRSETFQHEPE